MAKSSYIEVAYYSKSKCFLYPILDYRRSETFNPETYLFFGNHSILNGELIVHYTHKGDLLFENFQKMNIEPHPLLMAVYKVPTGTVYIFDISKYMEDILHFLAGEYSQFTKSLKTKVLKYLGDDPSDLECKPNREAHAVLYPEGYRPLIAKEWAIKSRDLGELAPIFDTDKETLEYDNSLAKEVENNTPI